jgi:hypothetical protein
MGNVLTDMSMTTPSAASAQNIDPNSGLAPATGWAAQQNYTPAMLSELYENPWYALGDVFPRFGTQEGVQTPLYQALRDFGADPLALYQLMAGPQVQGPMEGGSDFANWIANLYKQLGTPGGQAPQSRQLLSNLFGADSKSALGLVLGAGDMGTQVRTLFNLARDASNAGMDPLQARGYQAALARAGDLYGNSQMSAGEGQSQSFQEWANLNAPWLTGR